MGRWLFDRTGDTISVCYYNAQQLTSYPLGCVRADTPPADLLRLLVDNEQWSPGDWVMFSHGSRTTSLQFAYASGTA